MNRPYLIYNAKVRGKFLRRRVIEGTALVSGTFIGRNPDGPCGPSKTLGASRSKDSGNEKPSSYQ